MKSVSTELIEKAWALRYDQRIEESLALMSEIMAETGITASELKGLDLSTLQNSIEPQVAVELLLLQGAMARHRGDLELAWSYQERARLFTLSDQNKNYRQFFEAGITLFVQSDYVLALDEFQMAVAKARTPLERLFSLVNILLCYENLGQDYQYTLKLINDLLEIIPANLGQCARDQLRSFNLRQDFVNGRIDLSRSDSGHFAQDDYYKIWLTQLPYLSEYKHLTEEQIRPLREAMHFHKRGYRLRTIQGLLHPSDQFNIKATDLIQRLYLWTWRWLTLPTQQSLERVMQIVAELDLDLMRKQATAHDKQLLKNALLWLSLFDPASLRRLEKWIRRLDTASSGLGAFEELLIQYFIALRDGNEALASDYHENMKCSLLAKSTNIHLGRLPDWIAGKENECPPHLRVFVLHLRGMLHRPAKLSHPLTVDLAHFTIQTSAEKIASMPLAHAFDILRRNGSVKTSEFMRICFGILHYDPLDHNIRLFNLLARMKKLCAPHLKIKVRDGCVHALGEWSFVNFQTTITPSSELQAHMAWKTLLSEEPTPTLKTNRIMRSKRLGHLVERRELEEYMGKSRSTTHRLIARWMKEGLIERVGHSCATKYKIHERLRRKLEVTL